MKVTAISVLIFNQGCRSLVEFFDQFYTVGGDAIAIA